MASSKASLYPDAVLSNPDATSAACGSSSDLYPSIDEKDLAENVFTKGENDAIFQSRNDQEPPHEEILIRIAGAVVHLIEKERSLELACGELTMLAIKQGDTVVAVLARVGNQIQWPLAKDEASVKLDQSHYFFTLIVPPNKDRHSDDNDDDDDGIGQEIDLLNYGVTLASKGQERLLQEFDKILETYSSISVQEAREPGNVAMETSPEELKAEEKKKELMKESSAAYWTVLAPNVDYYSESVAKMIAAGSGQLIKGILWCGDVTVDRLKWGNEFLKERMTKS